MGQTLRILVLGDDLLENAFMGRAEGTHLGLATSVADDFAGQAIDLDFRRCMGTAELRSTLDDSSVNDPFDLETRRPDVVIIAVTDDVVGLPGRSADPAAAVQEFSQDLVSAIDSIKDRTGSHVVVANVSTYEPIDPVSSLYGLDPEPVSIRAHRIDLALLKISHLLGISIIDVDRVTAHVGCGKVIPASLSLTPEGSQVVLDETIRILADYGFFDERPIAPQVGNRSTV